MRLRVLDAVKAASVLYTDEAGLYVGMDGTYFHKTIAHKEPVYVSGDVHTQTIEGFFSTLKNGIRGTYHAVSRKWLQGYLNEYVYRYNTRDDTDDPFRTLILRAVVS